MAISSYSKTFLKNVERFKSQKEKLNKLERVYKSYADKYYGKNKRQDLLGNQFDIVNKIDPYKLTNKALNSVVKSNVQGIKSIGINSSMKGDYANAMVLVHLNNESINAVLWEYDGVDQEILNVQKNSIMGDILLTSLKTLRLTEYQIKVALSRSILPNSLLDMIQLELRDYSKKLSGLRK